MLLVMAHPIIMNTLCDCLFRIFALLMSKYDDTVHQIRLCSVCSTQGFDATVPNSACKINIDPKIMFDTKLTIFPDFAKLRCFLQLKSNFLDVFFDVFHSSAYNSEQSYLKFMVKWCTFSKSSLIVFGNSNQLNSTKIRKYRNQTDLDFFPICQSSNWDFCRTFSFERFA